MASSGTKAQKCPTPNCGAVMEKIDGCDHMTCPQCKKHICWLCLAYYDSATECYDHLSSVHGGAFDYPDIM